MIGYNLDRMEIDLLLQMNDQSRNRKGEHKLPSYSVLENIWKILNTISYKEPTKISFSEISKKTELSRYQVRYGINVTASYGIIFTKKLSKKVLITPMPEQMNDSNYLWAALREINNLRQCDTKCLVNNISYLLSNKVNIKNYYRLGISPHFSSAEKNNKERVFVSEENEMTDLSFPEETNSLLKSYNTVPNYVKEPEAVFRSQFNPEGVPMFEFNSFENEVSEIVSAWEEETGRRGPRKNTKEYSIVSDQIKQLLTGTHCLTPKAFSVDDFKRVFKIHVKSYKTEDFYTSEGYRKYLEKVRFSKFFFNPHGKNIKSQSLFVFIALNDLKHFLIEDKYPEVTEVFRKFWVEQCTDWYTLGPAITAKTENHLRQGARMLCEDQIDNLRDHSKLYVVEGFKGKDWAELVCKALTNYTNEIKSWWFINPLTYEKTLIKYMIRQDMVKQPEEIEWWKKAQEYGQFKYPVLGAKFTFPAHLAIGPLYPPLTEKEREERGRKTAEAVINDIPFDDRNIIFNPLEISSIDYFNHRKRKLAKKAKELRKKELERAEKIRETLKELDDEENAWYNSENEEGRK